MPFGRGEANISESRAISNWADLSPQSSSSLGTARTVHLEEVKPSRRRVSFSRNPTELSVDDPAPTRSILKRRTVTLVPAGCVETPIREDYPIREGIDALIPQGLLRDEDELQDKPDKAEDEATSEEEAEAGGVPREALGPR